MSKKLNALFREDWGECSIRPPCGHDGGGAGGQVPSSSVSEDGTWTCCFCGLKIEVSGASPEALDNWADAIEALITWPDGDVQLMSICNA